MPKIADGVAETTTTTGTGTLTLAGAKAGFRAFSAGFSNSDEVYYSLRGGSEWESGIGVYNAGTLTRATILASSNAGSAVNLSAGSKDVFCSATSDALVALGPYASTGALETAKPAAKYTGRIGLIGSSAPHTPYISNGTAWVVFDSGSDPLVTIAASGATVSQPAANLSVLDVTLTANTTIGFSGIPPGAWTATLILKQDATGSRLVTWPASTKWASGPAPTLSTAAAAIDIITLMTTDGGTTWYGFLNGRGMV